MNIRVFNRGKEIFTGSTEIVPPVGSDILIGANEFGNRYSYHVDLVEFDALSNFDMNVHVTKRTGVRLI